MMSKQYANEIKILSCQPDEFSLEGEEWGGGRGCFSYHLVDALYGFADANRDLQVSLFEAQQYLQNIVPTESLTGQMPFTVGNPKTPLATVYPEGLDAWQKQKKQPGAMSPFAGKGMDAILLAGVDSSLQELYHAFNAALERGDLLTTSAADGGKSANDYYSRLILEPEMAKLHGVMTRNLAAALQDEAQLVINQVLRTDPQIVDDAFSPVGKYDHLPAYLARAAELLGERHFMYRFLKAKEYYFRSKTYRKERYPEVSPDSLLRLSLASLDTALGFDSMAAYVYLEKGQLYYWNKAQLVKAFANFDKAVALSPEWVTALYYAGRVRNPLYGLNKSEEGILLLKKAIELDSSFLPSYHVLGGEYPLKREENEFWLNEYVARMKQYVSAHPDKVPVAYWNYYGNSLWRLKRLDEAEAALLKGAEASNHQFGLIYINLAVVYRGKKEFEKAIEAGKKAKELYF